jgi:hypothetical protein
MRILEKNQIEMGRWEQENDKRLAESTSSATSNNQSRMSKKRRMKMLKI